MPYIESICEAGKTVEIERYHTARYGVKGERRNRKKNPTTDAQRKQNNAQAFKKLRRILNANYEGGDYHLILTYARAAGEPVKDKEEMKTDAERFLRLLRKAYKSLGRELKYVHVMEIGSRGARHHHLVINAIDIGIIQKCWTHGRIHVHPLDDSGDYAMLALYLLKYSNETVGTTDALQKKRWNSSRNLIHPEPKKRVVTRSWFRKEARVPAKYSGKGYKVTETASGLTEDGYPYFRFIILRC